MPWKWALVPFLLVAVYTDWRSHKIYNWLTLPALVLGLAASFLFGSWPGLLSSLQGAGLALGIFLVLYLVAKFGAGDLKLMTAIGAWVGYPHILTVLVDVALVGGVFSLAIALRHGALRQVLRNLYYFVVSMFTPGIKPAEMLTKSALPPFPYGISIALGTVLALCYPDPF